jgi:hypothetical protein
LALAADELLRSSGSGENRSIRVSIDRIARVVNVIAPKFVRSSRQISAFHHLES